MKKLKKSILFLMVLAMTLCTPICAYANANTQKEEKSSKAASKSGNIETDDFAIKVVCGIQGNYKFSCAIPVSIDIESKNKDFTGMVRIIVPGSSWYGSEAMAYEKEVLLSAGTAKRITLSAYCDSPATSFTFQLDNEKGKTIIDQSIKIGSKANQNALVGVLSDDYTALNYFDKLEIVTTNYNGISQLVELSEADIPEHASGLECISYLIINIYDTSKLSEDQLNAVKEWVSHGGVLIVGGGSDYKQTISGFSDLISISGAKNTEAELSIAKESESSDDNKISFKGNGELVQLDIEDANDLSKVISQDGFVKDVAYNKGHIVITGFNLGMEPISGWSEASELAGKLYVQSVTGYSAERLASINYGTATDFWSVRQMLDSIGEYKYPHAIPIVIALVLFVLFGPIIYFILKKLDKREMLWLLIPAVSVVATVVIFIANADVRIRYPIAKSMTVINDGNGVNVDLGVLVPGKNHEEITTTNELANFTILSNSDGYYDSSKNAEWNNKYTSSVRQVADGYVLGYDNESTFQTKYVGFDYVGKVDTGEGLITDCTRSITGISGKVTNKTGYDLKQVIIMTYGRIVTLGDVKAGETREFTEDSNIAWYDMDFYSVKFPGLKQDNKDYNKILNSYVLTYNSYISSDIDADRASVFSVGYINNWNADYVQDENVVEYNEAIYLKQDKVGYSDYEDMEIANMFSFTQASNEWDKNDGQMYKTQTEAQFDLSQSMDKVYALIRAKDGESRYGQTKNTKIFAWNYAEEKYEELFENNVVEKFENGCPYINEDGIMKLQFTATKEYEDYVPFITVVGGYE